ncbi:MarR family winged helix-turn-helix transcriptional regulator [Amycolatopsis jiangsuensis]|uniref:DNA-binding MarR family transcriptional regulator n=1 Tax=Amycolatopsis jiangsuensis TaxID=1181879 RepID=A0A840J5J4_9PSEU|nr:MarR family transcriptional regulator [Amycolatopsis jiangsuensis]MBB4688678.1 DNA-binding MarR family transcriptional regulator [Amycolatopsis jiangsuensis]
MRRESTKRESAPRRARQHVDATGSGAGQEAKAGLSATAATVRAAKPDAEQAVEELSQAADRLFYAMRRSRALTVGQASDGLSLAQLALLAPLTEAPVEPGLPVGRLASAAEVSVPTATRMLKHLEAKGVVTRRRSPADERQVLIRLTGDGTKRLAAVRDDLRARQRHTLNHYTPAELRALATDLQRLARVIAEQ